MDPACSKYLLVGKEYILILQGSSILLEETTALDFDGIQFVFKI